MRKDCTAAGDGADTTSVFKEGSKRTDHIYFPFVKRMRVPALSYRQLKDKLNNLGVKAGLYRKFANQVLEQLAHENNIPLDVVALIMSRGLTVTGAHYLNTRENGQTSCLESM